MTDSQHFEIHYLPALAPELDRVVRSAERACDRISGQLNFVFPTKVPLVMFTPSGPMTREEVRTYAGSNQVAPPSPHRSRIVLALPQGDAQLDALIVHELTHLLVREIIWPGRAGEVPALSQLSGSGGFANARVNDAVGHAAFDDIESRWGPNNVRRFLTALSMPHVSKIYDAVFDLTAAEFDAAFRQYAERRFAWVVR
jgi:hypothetical protein